MHAVSRSQRIAVTGATGRVGSHLVEVLEQRGHDVVPIARSQGVDVVSGGGLDEALVGVETIIDAATGPSPGQEEATAFFIASARNLQRAGAAAGAKRIVVVSIIGIDKFHGGYNAAKLAQERTLLEGPLPVRIVRAAQFHEFVGPLVGWTIQDGVAYVPEMRTQLVAARVVAETLADAAEEPEIENGRITEVAGPQEERLADAAAALFASRGDSIRDPRHPRRSAGAARRPRHRGLRRGRRAAQPGREARRPELRRVARGGQGVVPQRRIRRALAGSPVRDAGWLVGACENTTLVIPVKSHVAVELASPWRRSKEQNSRAAPRRTPLLGRTPNGGRAA